MSDNNDKIIRNGDDYSGITATELKYVIEVNKKAIELYVEVEKQNEEILRELEELKERKYNDSDSLEKIHDDIKLLNNKLDLMGNKFDSLNNRFDSILKTIGKVDEIDKNLFRLLVFLSVLGAGMIFQVLNVLFKH